MSALLGLGSPVAVVGPNGLLVGKVHSLSVGADGTDLVEVEAAGKLIPALPAYWFCGEGRQYDAVAGANR